MKRSEAGKLVSRCAYLTAADKSVFRTLLERANNDDCAVPAKYTPTVAQLVQSTSLARASVFRALTHLETHRWLVRTPGNGRTHKSSYALAGEQPDVGCTCERVSSRKPERVSSPGSKGSHRETVTASNGLCVRPERVSLAPEFPQVKPRFGTREAEEEKGGSGCKINPDDNCRGAATLLSCQLCPKSPTYWRTAS